MKTSIKDFFSKCDQIHRLTGFYMRATLALNELEVKELNIRCTAAYSKPYQSSKMELYAKIVNNLLRGYLFY